MLRKRVDCQTGLEKRVLEQGPADLGVQLPSLSFSGSQGQKKADGAVKTRTPEGNWSFPLKEHAQTRAESVCLSGAAVRKRCPLATGHLGRFPIAFP